MACRAVRRALEEFYLPVERLKRGRYLVVLDETGIVRKRPLHGDAQFPRSPHVYVPAGHALRLLHFEAEPVPPRTVKTAVSFVDQLVRRVRVQHRPPDVVERIAVAWHGPGRVGTAYSEGLTLLLGYLGE